MSYYGYHYERRCYVPGAVKFSAPTFPQRCHGPGVATCSSCAPAATKLCTASKTLASPRCPGPCQPACMETHVVEGHHHHHRRSCSSSSSCGSSRCLQRCSVPFPQPPVASGCPQACGPTCQHGSWPYSYQWSNSYQYRCGQ